jgi:ABC-type multidrug transport system fused ATPase/permease subunit
MWRACRPPERRSSPRCGSKSTSTRSASTSGETYLVSSFYFHSFYAHVHFLSSWRVLSPSRVVSVYDNATTVCTGLNIFLFCSFSPYFAHRAATSLLFSLFTFGAFAVSGKELTPQIAFTSLALFNVLIGPLNSFPWVVNGIVEAMVSLKRLEGYMAAEEVPEALLLDSGAGSGMGLHPSRSLSLPAPPPLPPPASDLPLRTPPAAAKYPNGSHRSGGFHNGGNSAAAAGGATTAAAAGSIVSSGGHSAGYTPPTLVRHTATAERAGREGFAVWV